MTLDRILGAFPGSSLITDADRLVTFGTDLTGRFRHLPIAVVRPASVDEVAAIVRTCNEHGFRLVPQGGNTGLVGGAIPTSDEIVMSLAGLGHVGDVDEASRCLVAEAGATLQSVQDAARAHGLELPIDFAARASATIGGMIATDAGGALALRHGTMRDRVAGLEVVLADGTVIDHLDRPEKDSSGFDLTRLIPGSEGTLGIVTRARLRLTPHPSHRSVALVAFEGIEEAARVTARLRSTLPSLEAADFFLEGGLELVRERFGLPPPFGRPHGAYVVLSCSGNQDPTYEMGEAVSHCDEVSDVVVAQSAEQRDKLWSYRELHNESINATGVPHKLDVSVAPNRVPALVASVDDWLARHRPQARGVYYGHLADGNVHVNVIGAERDDDAIDEAVFTRVAELGGSISAEHGVGQAKARWLHLSRPPAEIAKMWSVKRALDPNEVLNPGKLLPPSAGDHG